jgi:hypothetical protein
MVGVINLLKTVDTIWTTHINIHNSFTLTLHYCVLHDSRNTQRLLPQIALWVTFREGDNIFSVRQGLNLYIFFDKIHA